MSRWSINTSEISQTYLINHKPFATFQWQNNGRDEVSNLQPHDCSPNHLFRHIWEKTSKLCVAGLFAGNSPVTGEFPAKMASNAENVFIWWRHHGPTIKSSENRLLWVNCWRISDACIRQAGEFAGRCVISSLWRFLLFLLSILAICVNPLNWNFQYISLMNWCCCENAGAE